MSAEVATRSGVLFRKLLIPVDFSPCSLEAFRVALRLARVCGAELILLHVIDTKTLDALDRLGLAQVTAEAGQIKRLRRHARIKARELLGWEETKGLSIRRLVVEGIPFVEIGRLVRTDRIDLVVLGSWGGETGQVERIFFGSTAEKVVRTAGCPVLTIPLAPGRRRAVDGAQTKGWA
ncbi:MAG: hypothetical protein OJF52_002119 [Nitrospira sp.]|jgi:nucleotide-binding universal stress UspA family protein|nr:MAG: hypothetical protein OJF52_002119 [Nitrospira sp.]